MNFSIVVAVYNRTDELTELLQSLVKQTYKNFEVIVVDDGSQEDLKPVINLFSDKLKLVYHKKINSGPGLSRNVGATFASNEYLIFLDSDCIAPEDYLQNVINELSTSHIDAFGGPDAAHEDFNTLQKAISYAMTSLLTTGGIRGGKKSVGKFQPRSFNMGIRREVFLKLGGFADMRVGEDPDLSMTLWENNYQTQLFHQAKVYHKRRTSLSKFAKQVYQFGTARPILNKRHPKYTKLTFWFPSVFLLGSIFSIVLSSMDLFFSLSILFSIPLFLLATYFLAIFIHSGFINKSLQIGLLSIVTSAIQLYSYGFGFLKSYFKN